MSSDKESNIMNKANKGDIVEYWLRSPALNLDRSVCRVTSLSFNFPHL